MIRHKSIWEFHWLQIQSTRVLIRLTGAHHVKIIPSAINACSRRTTHILILCFWLLPFYTLGEPSRRHSNGHERRIMLTVSVASGCWQRENPSHSLFLHEVRTQPLEPHRSVLQNCLILTQHNSLSFPTLQPRVHEMRFWFIRIRHTNRRAKC